MVVLEPCLVRFPGLGAVLGALGGIWGVEGASSRVLGPSWARLEPVLDWFFGVRGASLGVIFGSWGGPFWVWFAGSFRNASWNRFELNLEPKSARKWGRERHRNQLRSVKAKILIFDNPPTFFSDFCLLSELPNAPEWSEKWLPKRCPEEDENKT